jgi:hypothetical protein
MIRNWVPFQEGVFSPDDIAGLQGWWKADALALSNDDPVVTWADSSAAANDLTLIGGNSPLYKTIPTVRFDNADDGMGVNGIGLVAGELTLFAVYNSQSTSGSHRAVQGSNNWLIGPYDGKHELYAGNFASPAGPAVQAGVFVIQTVTLDSSTATNYIDGASIGTVSSPTYPGANLFLAYSVGSPPYPEALNGDVAEVLVYDSLLSDPDREDVEAYLTDKWGL